MLTINGFEEKNCQQFLCEHEFCFYKESNREFAYIFLIDAEKLQYIQKGNASFTTIPLKAMSDQV